jgi:hypothetical protein
MTAHRRPETMKKEIPGRKLGLLNNKTTTEE